MLVLSAVSLCFALAAIGTQTNGAKAASVGQLQQQINDGQGAMSSLSGAVSADSSKLGQLNASISALQQKISHIQADLDAKRAELLKLRSELDVAKARLAQLEADMARDQSVLSQQLVNSYESDRPDLISVVLEAKGFQDLLERLSFQKQIRSQDVAVITRVKAIRVAVVAQATKLGALELRQQQLTEQVLAQRNQLAASKISLVQQQLAVARSRASNASKLAGVRSRVSSLQGQLSKLLAAQAVTVAAAQAQSSSYGASYSGSASASPGANGFTFPLPKGSVSGPGSWSEDQGVDISAPGDTPEFAVCSGTIVLHGIGGFGPSAPVLHCDSPVGGYSYVYYGHAGPANQLPDGTHVSAGQVMSSVGPGIVGISTGPHIEIGFSDGSGTPIGGGSASTMMSLLQGSY